MKNYNLTVITEGQTSTFTTERLQKIYGWENIIFINKVTESPDKSATTQIPENTTHLLLETIDVLDRSLIKNLKKLKYIGLTYTGWWDYYFDVKALKKRQIKLAINKTYATIAVAEASFAALLFHARRLHYNHPNSNILYSDQPGFELNGKYLAIIGKGGIGKAIQNIAKGFNMHATFFDTRTSGQLLENNKFDIISINVPKSAGEIIDLPFLQKLTTATIIINSSGWENISIPDLVLSLTKFEQMSYIHIAYPEPKIQIQLAHLKNAFFYPLFSNSTIESISKRITIPLQSLERNINNEQDENCVL